MTDEEQKAADEAKAKADEEAKGKGPDPKLDLSTVKDAVKEIMQDLAKKDDDDDKSDYIAPTPDESKGRAPEDPVQKLVAPYVQGANLNAEAALDAVNFYAATPEAAPYAKDLAKAHKAGMEGGISYTHSALWEWYQGKNQDKFFEIREKKKAADLKKAEDAETLDTGGRPIDRTSGKVLEAQEADDEQLEGGLKDLEF